MLVKKKKKAWVKGDQYAIAKIALSVEDNQIIHIKHEQTAKGIWNS